MHQIQTLCRIHLLGNLLALVYAQLPLATPDTILGPGSKRGVAAGGVPTKVGGNRRVALSDILHAGFQRDVSHNRNRKVSGVGQMLGDEPHLATTLPPYQTETRCFDIYAEAFCRRLAAQGHCEKNPRWMLPNCRESCGVCGKRAQCIDYNDECEEWALGGQCRENHGYMQLYCRWSCSLCDGMYPDEGSGEVADEAVIGKAECWQRNDWCSRVADAPACKNSTACQTDDDVSICPHACGICDKDPGCRNYNEHCAGWAEHGECNRNPGYMRILCRPSCGCCN